MSTHFFAWIGLAVCCLPSVFAQDRIKIGVLAPMSGPFAEYGQQMTAGMKAYIQQHGDVVAGKKIALVIKDTTGPAPEIAKRLAQELIVGEKVSFLAGFGLTPNTLAVAPLATKSQTPMIVMNAASKSVVKSSPYIVRTSFSLPQVIHPMADWASRNEIRKIYTIVADYAPGHDAEEVFQKAFTQQGGNIVGQLRVPIRNPDFAPYMQRIKDARPQAVFVFLPAGELSIGFMKAAKARRLKEEGIRILTTGDVVDDSVLNAIGDAALGVTSTHHYSLAHPSAENQAFITAYRVVNPKSRANFMAVSAYDGMAAIYHVIKQQNGNINGALAINLLKGFKLQSPRGPIQIDTQTRDVIQDVYVRKVQKINGTLYNVEFDRYKHMLPNI